MCFVVCWWIDGVFEFKFNLLEIFRQRAQKSFDFEAILIMLILGCYLCVLLLKNLSLVHVFVHF